MNFYIADTFKKSLSALEPQEQSQVKQASFDFQMNPSNPGFKKHRVKGSKDKDFWTAYVNDEMRIIYHQKGDRLVLCYTGHHEPVYQWARNRRLTVNAEVNSAQLVIVVEKEEVHHVLKETEPPLFGAHEDTYLLKMGVPKQELPSLRGLTEAEQLLDWIEVLPIEVVERLMALAEGKPVSLQPLEETQDPFLHPDAKSHFHLVESHDALKQALDATWEQWMLFLHPKQAAVVTRSFKGPTRVTGAAGTGKTVVALHRAAHLAKQSVRGQILVTTYSKTLASRLEQKLDILLKGEPKARARIRVDHIHKLARAIVARSSSLDTRCIRDTQLEDFIRHAASREGHGTFSVPFLLGEWENIVEPWDVSDFVAYKMQPRKGRLRPLGARQKKIVWAIYQHVLDDMNGHNATTWGRLCHQASRILERGKAPYRHVIADECQDFGPAELRLLRALAPKASNDLFLCGDLGQRIYKNGFSWSSAGVEIRGRSKILKVNYRTTQQIRVFADRLLPAEEEENLERSSVSLLEGLEPKIIVRDTEAEEIATITSLVDGLLIDGFAPSEIGIFARLRDQLQRPRKALKSLAIATHDLEDDSPLSVTGVSLGTMHRAKGLEYRAVLIVACGHKFLPLKLEAERREDASDRKAALAKETRLLYVACTRARERLFITATGEASKLFSAVE